MIDDTTKAEIRDIVEGAEALVSGYRTIGRALTNPQEVGMADLILRLAVVVDRLVVPHMADGPEAPQEPKKDVGPGMRKAVDVLGRRLAGMDWGPQHKDAIVGCIEALRDQIVRVGEETPNQGGSPASQSVYVALFDDKTFMHIERIDGIASARAYIDGWCDRADNGDGYIIPDEEPKMKQRHVHKDYLVAMHAWADAVQSDGVAEQKDGGSRE